MPSSSFSQHTRYVVTVVLWTWFWWIISLGSATAESPHELEAVSGTGCYRFGDDETPAKARRAAVTLAQEEAIRRHRVFVEASTRVKNFQLDEDIVRTASAAFLQDIVVEKEERKNQEICVTVTARLSPLSAEEMLRQRISAKEISHEAQSLLVPAHPAFGLRVWTNKDTHRYVEDERLIVYVQSDRDAYLKLDYFQADGQVLHLVPNIYRGQAHILGGKTYAFGDDAAPEHFIVKEPFGDEIIKAMVSTKPFELSPSTEPTSDSRTYLRSGLRGVKVVAAEASVPLKTMSSLVEKYDRDVPQSNTPIRQ
jgi:hypothetical protein